MNQPRISKTQYVAFLADPELVRRIDNEAQKAQRTRSQELRFRLLQSFTADAPRRTPHRKEKSYESQK